MEEQEEQKQEEQQQPEPDMIERANQAADRLHAETAALKSEREKLEKLRVSERLGGQSEAGSGQKKETSNKDYAAAALRGEKLE